MSGGKRNTDARALARFGLLAALALILGWLERLFPTGIPGVKPGLGNIVLLYAIYLLGAREAALLMLVKVFLPGFLFGSLSSILYSLAGGVLSLAAMLPLRKIPKLSAVFVSMGGALAHNLGQALAACLAIPIRAVLAYVPILLLSGLGMGLLTGLVARYTLPALRRSPLNPGDRHEAN